MAAEPKHFNILSYVLSRFAFIATHVVFAYWVNFLLNDPFSLGGNTLDYRVIQPADTCTRYIKENIVQDLLLFALWWGSHSIFARTYYKKAVGLWEHPVERPLFAAIASVAWGINVHYWKPITDCERYDALSVPLYTWIISGTVIALAFGLVVGFLWVLPDHVFGTAKYQYAQGKFPKGELLGGFPYGLVRHPAATGFLWAYWALPAHTLNHVFLAALWTIFIVVGTLAFEEGGLKDDSEFGRQYNAYRKQVPAFYPSLTGLKEFLGISKPKGKNSVAKAIKAQKGKAT